MKSGQLVQEAEKKIREWLDSSSFKKGDRLPSERALSKQLGLQHYALNRAMGRLASEGLVRREGYKLFYTASALLPAGFCWDLVVSRRSIFLKSYLRVAREMQIDFKIHGWTTFDDAVALLNQLDCSQTKAVICDPPHPYPPAVGEALLRLHRHGIPVVSVRQHVLKVSSVLHNPEKSFSVVVSHLEDLGHTKIARVFPPAFPERSPEFSHHFWDSLSYVPNVSSSLAAGSKQLAEKLVTDWKEVTALIFLRGSIGIIPPLLEQLKNLRKVPGDLSLVSLDDAKMLQNTSPSVSAVASDPDVIEETAFRLLQRIIRKKEESGIMPAPICIRIDPQVIVRASIGAVPVLKDPARAALVATGLKRNRDYLREELNFSLRRPYSFASKIRRSHFNQIELEEFTNRHLNFRRGWLGDLPLKNFPPGQHTIHGIPFQVLGGPNRGDCGAIVFKSSTNVTGNAQKLPDQLDIPVNAKASAVYVLHGCGYSGFLQPFASYTFYQGRKKLGSVPMVSLGTVPSDYNLEKLGAEIPAPNIQDWWPDYQQMDFPHARMAPITDEGGISTVHRTAYLYTLEWINPFPESTISHIRIQVDPESPTVLGVLSVSLLQAEKNSP